MSRLLPLIASIGLSATAQTPPTPQDAPVAAEFQQRISDYLKTRQAAEGEIKKLKPTNSLEAIKHHEHELAERIREARKQAKPGDIFAPAIAAMFRRLISQTMQTSEAPAIQASLNHAEPSARVPDLRVNANYPERTPLQSTPASLLLNLPKLPPQLEYRFSGRTLILRDQGANLIVDFITGALP